MIPPYARAMTMTATRDAAARRLPPPGRDVSLYPAAVLALDLAGPVHVVAPRVRDRLRADPDLDRWDPARPRRGRPQRHARLGRGPVRLVRVARVAARHNVVPRGPAVARPRDHVVVGQLVDRAPGAAVLAAVAVARVDVDPRELHQLGVAAERLAQTHDRRDLHDHRGRADLGIVLLDDVDLVEDHEGHRALPGNDLDRFVALVEQERTRGIYVHRSTSPCLSGALGDTSAGPLVSLRPRDAGEVPPGGFEPPLDGF